MQLGYVGSHSHLRFFFCIAYYVRLKHAFMAQRLNGDIYVIRIEQIQKYRKARVLTSMRRMSIERTVVKKNICRKKSDTSPTTANRQNS